MKSTSIDQKARAVVLYSLNAWENALPLVRVIGPARQAGLRVIPGNRMETVSPRLVSAADLVIIQRDFPRLARHYTEIRQRARSEGKRLIFDLDDLLLELPDLHPDRQNQYYREANLPIMQAMLDADMITTSTLPLKEYAHTFNLCTSVIPNYLNDQIWSMRPPRNTEGQNGPLVIGYIGSSTHEQDLESISPALTELLRAYPDRVVFKFWGVQPPAALRGHHQVEWTSLWIYEYARYAAYLGALHCDIVIAPMQNNPFNHHKSALKFLEYSSLGWPGVYSRITPYQEIIQHGVNGLLAESLEEWVAAISDLVSDAELRWRLAQEAQRTVRAHWLLSTHTAELQQIYQQVLPDAYGAGQSLTASGQKIEQTLIQIRVAVTPPGSLRERIALAPTRAAQILNTEGASGMARRLREYLSGDTPGSQTPTPHTHQLVGGKAGSPIPDSDRQYLPFDEQVFDSGIERQKASIIVLSYNNINYTRLCLNSILTSSSGQNYEIIVVDNASTDGTPRFLQEFAVAHPSVRLILNKANEGFARGNNQGAMAATGEVLIFLNNDTAVTPGWLPNLEKYLRVPQVGMVGPVTNDSGNESCIDVSYHNLSDMVRFAETYTHSHTGKAFEIPMLAFLCVALRRTVFEEVGPLDDQFGLGMFEDDDYAIRVKLKGYQIICAQDAFVHHWGSASFSRLPGKLFYQLFNENRRKFENKWGYKWTPYRLKKKTPTIYHS